MYPTTIRTSNKLSQHAAALVAFANSNKVFSELLFKYVASLDTSTCEKVVFDPSLWLIPNSLKVAEQRASWLMQELAFVNKNKTDEARAILSTWAKEYKEPQDIVLCVIGVAFIGPTLGLIKKKKKG